MTVEISSASPHVSVIIPAFNAERWIRQTLESVLNQTYENVEVLVIDDHSEDSTAEIVAGIGDPRVRLLHQPHRGAAAARNRGLEASRGHFIQFLDADDLLSPRKIERQLEALNREASLAVACCAWAHFEEKPSHAMPTPELVWHISDPLEWLVVSLQGGGMMQPACWLTPRELLDNVGVWNESLTLHDDGEFFSRVLVNARKVIFVDDVIVHYRSVPDSLSRQRTKRDVDSAFAVCEARHRVLLQKRDDSDSRRAIATQYAQFAYEFGGVAPDLAAKALSAIRETGVEPALTIGGMVFRRLAAWIGFSAALRLRSALA